MSRYRLVPTPAQEPILRRHRAHARCVWNLAVEQQSWWRPGRHTAPGYRAQAAQLTDARADFRWLADGSQLVQQQALRDFAQAMASLFAGTHRKPTWRKAGQDEGFRIVAVKASRIRAHGRVRRISPAFTSQRCSACGTTDGRSRESQADFACRSCGYACNADVKAARNIAAGHAVTARGRSPLGGRMNREPQPLPLSA